MPHVRNVVAFVAFVAVVAVALAGAALIVLGSPPGTTAAQEPPVASAPATAGVDDRGWPVPTPEEQARMDRALVELLGSDWLPVGIGPDGQPLGYLPNPNTNERFAAGRQEVFDRPGGEVIGELDPVAGLIPVEVLEEPGFDVAAYRDEVAPGRAEALEQEQARVAAEAEGG